MESERSILFLDGLLQMVAARLDLVQDIDSVFFVEVLGEEVIFPYRGIGRRILLFFVAIV